MYDEPMFGPSSMATRKGRGPRKRLAVLVDLLENRSELRGTYAPADYLDEAVRWSA